jgi:hypothetical protein
VLRVGAESGPNDEPLAEQPPRMIARTKTVNVADIHRMNARLHFS